MRNVICGCAALALLGACQPQPDLAADGFFPLDHAPPLEVAEALPAGVSHDELVVSFGCYYYLRDGRAVPIPSRAMRDAGITDQPYCIG